MGNLKVTTSYTPQGALKVTNNPNGFQYAPNVVQNTAPSPQQTANPQPPTYNPQKATYNPQPAASTYQLRNVTPQQFQDAARRMQEEQDRIRAEQEIQRKRLADAKMVEIGNLKGGFANTLKDKATFGELRRQRGGRELAVKYYKENENNWATQIMARQRRYEKKGSELKDWVMQSSSEEEYNQRVQQATDWLDKEYKAIDADIKDYQVTQLELANYAELPLSGKLPSVARFGKNMIGGIAGTSWNALTWTASQPQRAVNTAKNFVNPNNLRLYYGGDEKKGGLIGQGSNPVSQSWDQLRKSYNASREQRTFGRSKADEEAKIKKMREQWIKNMKDNPDAKNIFGDSPYHGFLRNGDWLNEARIKYGDDVVDFMADPLNFFAGAGSASKVGKGSEFMDSVYKLAGKSKTMRNLILDFQAGKQWAKGSKFGERIAKLGKEFKPRNVQANEAIQSLLEDLRKTTTDFKASKNSVYERFAREKGLGNKIKSNFLIKQTEQQARLQNRTDVFRKQAERMSQDFIKNLEKFSDKEVRALTRFARNGEWSTFDKVKISKYRRADLEKFVGDYQTRARAMAKSEGLTRRAQNYLPEFTGRNYDPTARRTLFGEKYLGQSRQQLQESIVMREFMSNWDQSNDYLKQLSATEKAILRNAKKTNRGLTALEQQQLDLIQQRKAVLERLHTRFNSKTDAIRGAIDFTRQQAKPAFSFRGGKVRTNFTKQGFMNSASDIFHLPSKVWKKSVLKYNPAWYVNNTMWNIPASISAAGGGVFPEYLKLLKNKKYWNELRKTLPEGVMSKISQEIGGGGLASKIEDTSRIATFNALKKKGFTDEQALKQVNRWLFDYSTKNWERPIKGVLPFWQWQKNLLRLGTTMPFHSPRSAKVYSDLYEQFYQRPYNALPSETQTYTDPETGKQQTYDPRKFYKGKAKIGNNWYGLPFFAVNPETMLQFGTNPYLLSAMDYMTSTDRLENPNTNRKAWTILGERFPQVNLGRAYVNRDNKDTQTWFSQSGNSKQAQGFDPSKPNYKQNLDNNKKFTAQLKSFFGVPRAVKFDKEEFDTKKRLTDFNKEFFSIDWQAKEDQDYKQAQAEKEALAKKYGFDLQKDIYDKYWSKYDTETTTNTKRLKREAAQFNSPDSGYWRDYFALQKGTLTSPSQRRPFLIGKFDEWKRDHTFAQNPYYKLPNKGQINPFALKRQESDSQERRKIGKQKYARKLAYEEAVRTGDWSYFAKNPSGKRGFQSDGKFFKSAESAARYKRGQLWREYFNLDSKEARQAFLLQHPELQTNATPTTQAEWDLLRQTAKDKRKAKFAKLTGFDSLQQQYRDYVAGTYRPQFKMDRKVRFKV